MSATEFPRPFDRRGITAEPVRLAATEAERAALAERFEILAVKRLEAVLDLRAEGETIHVTGRLEADLVQSCAVSGEDLPVSVAEDLTLRFVPARPIEAEEIELEAEELDEIPYEGTSLDLGEALAQTLGLAIDPYLTGPEADKVRRDKGLLGEAPRGPLAEALAKLQRD